MPSESDEAEPIGWNAIDAKCREIHGDQEPLHWAPILSYRSGGPDPLEGVSAYACDEPRHWHFVTYGFSELYEKEQTDQDISGFGFELTFRLARGDEAEPSPWCVNFLQNIARYVFKSGNTFQPGHYVDLNGPIALTSPTQVKAIVFMEDPQFGTIETKNGRVQFLQIIGITLDELAAIRSWQSASFLELLISVVPLGLTDLARQSLLDRPELRSRIEEGRDKDGSSTGSLHVSALAWTQERRLLRGTMTTITIGATGAQEFGPVLRGRVPHGQNLAIIGANSIVVFEPGPKPSVEVKTQDDFSTLHVTVPAATARTLADLVQPKAGTYEHPDIPGLQIVVERSEIKDAQGRVVQVVG
jgi:suppressor of fused